MKIPEIEPGDRYIKVDAPDIIWVVGDLLNPHSSFDGKTPAEAYGAVRPVDMMDKPDGLPTFPQGLARHFGQAPQQRQDVIKRILAA